MNVPRLAAAVALLLAFAALPAAAQTARTVAPGDPVRVTATLRPPVRGTVVRTGPEGLVLRTGRDTLFTTWSELRALEVGARASRTRTALRFGGIGLLTGAATGAAVGSITYKDGGSGWCVVVCDRPDAALAGAALGAVSGAVLGGVVGAVRPQRQWRPASAPAMVSAAPAGGRNIAVQARIRF
jgi:hypothetical protein